MPLRNHSRQVMSSLFASQKFQRTATQVVFLAVLAALIISMVVIGRSNILARGMASGFGFLEQTTGWTLSMSVIEIGPRSTYARMLFAGLLNTLVVGLPTLVLASALGLLLALMRVSSNTPMKIVGATYVEIFRNVPLILQAFFWYAILTHTPGPRNAINFGDVVFFSNRGLAVPTLGLSTSGLLLLVAGAIAIVIGFRLGHNRGTRIQRLMAAAVAMTLLIAATLLIGREPGSPLISVPKLQGLRFVGGFILKPEYTALLIGLVLFGASYIGEIIRGGLLAVDKGRLEAGSALGLTRAQVNRLIRIPLAFRAMLPALTNQYVWLMKATTVGIAIGYPDYFAVISTSINQSGQTLELLGLLMVGFVMVNFSIAFVMNAINERLKIKGAN